MSNAMTRGASHGALATMDRAELRDTLRNSLYPGASDSSIDMVMSYCQAAGLDVMLKPVHIVPMWDSKSRTMRDVVMPGIGLYRTNASRTGQFAGMSEPEFGPMVTERLGSRDVTFPEWCRVSAYRQLPSGHVAAFTATEYWIENYAIKGGKEQDQAPNSMWAKRVRGQLAKCAQAQALRLAFPEATGAAPTADEMEGKAIIEAEHIPHDRPAAAHGRTERTEYPAADFAANLPKWRAAIDAGKKTADEIIALVESKGALSDAQKSAIRSNPEAIEGELVAEGDHA